MTETMLQKFKSVPTIFDDTVEGVVTAVEESIFAIISDAARNINHGRLIDLSKFTSDDDVINAVVADFTTADLGGKLTCSRFGNCGLLFKW